MSTRYIFEELCANLRSFRDIVDPAETLDWQEELVTWINGFIVKPHSDLGRKGAICPFVQKSLDRDLMVVTNMETPPLLGTEAGPAIIDAMRETFERTFSGDRRELGALILVFPGLDRDRSGGFIDEVHRLNRRRMIQSGVALGEFHPRSTTPGIHNPAFHPMFSPVPLFVMRALGKHDVFFLNREDFAIEDRIDTMRSFIDQMAGYMTHREKGQIDRDLQSLGREVEAGGLSEALSRDLKKIKVDHQ